MHDLRYTRCYYFHHLARESSRRDQRRARIAFDGERKKKKKKTLVAKSRLVARGYTSCFVTYRLIFYFISILSKTLLPVPTFQSPVRIIAIIELYVYICT